MAKHKKLTRKAAQKILADVDAWGGKPMSEAQPKKFRYIKTEGGVWELPTHILKAAGVKVGKNTSARRLTRT
jgi:hypothetical protein